jgi:hypothetical protein
MTSVVVRALEGGAAKIGEDIGGALEKFASSGVQRVRESIKASTSSAASKSHKDIAGIRSGAQRDKNAKLSAKRRSQIALVNAPAMRICWHPHHPLPPVMTTTLGQTHVMGIQQKNATTSSQFNTLVVDCMPRNLNVGSLNNYGYTAGYNNKKLPYFEFLLSTLYTNVICTGARIKAIYQGVEFSAGHDYQACLKLELDAEATASNLKWQNRATSISDQWNTSTMYFDSFENQGKGNYVERAPLLDDHTLTARCPSASAEEGPMEAVIHGHWSMFDHAGVNPQEVFMAKIRGEDVSGHELLQWCQTYGVISNPHRPCWHMFVIPKDLDSASLTTESIKVRLEVEYDLMFFGVRNPDPESVVDELTNSA